MGKHATVKEITQINKMLEEVLERHEDGTCSYKDGLSDDAVRTRLGVGSKFSVARVRNEVFGKLRPKTPIPNGDKLEMLRQHVNSLCISLGYAQLEW